MNNQNIAKDYAKIFFEVCQTNKKETEILYQTRLLAQNKQKSNNEINKILINPIIDKTIKLQIIDELKTLKLAKEINNLAKILVENNHFNYFFQIIEEYQKIYQEQQNIIIVKMTLARELSVQAQTEIQTMIEEKMDKYPIIITKYDPQIIGGAKIEYDNKIIDNTIKKHLKKLLLAN